MYTIQVHTYIICMCTCTTYMHVHIHISMCACIYVVHENSCVLAIGVDKTHTTNKQAATMA